MSMRISVDNLLGLAPLNQCRIFMVYGLLQTLDPKVVAWQVGVPTCIRASTETSMLASTELGVNQPKIKNPAECDVRFVGPHSLPRGCAWGSLPSKHSSRYYLKVCCRSALE
jgi:hypothetical protein